MRVALPSFRDRWTCIGGRHTRATHTIAPTGLPTWGFDLGTEEEPVNPTARWPERLEHLAALLRADALAVVSAGSTGPATIFSYRLSTPPEWFAALGEDVFRRAQRGPFVTAVPAGRWIDGAAYAVIASIESWNGEAFLCGLRQDVPFDAIDASAAASAARLLEMSALEGRALAETLRQSASLEERLQVLSEIGDELAHARDAGAILTRAAEEVARRMGAGGVSIMVIEDNELRLMAAVGLPEEIQVGRRQRLDEGIAGWVARTGEKVALRGRIDDERFGGVDPDAIESVVVPLREGTSVLGVLSVKRPREADGFDDRHDLLDAMASDIARALRAMNLMTDLERERADAHAYAEMARAVAEGDVDRALRGALALGHHAVALRDPSGRILGVRAEEGDDDCRESAITASARTHTPGEPSVGFARHGDAYHEEESELAQQAADTLTLLGRAREPAPGTALRVLAVEDHPVMRLGLRTMLEREGFVIAGATATCGEALGLLDDARPDVVLLDLRLPDATGAEAVIRMREAAPILPIIAFSVDRTPALIRAVLRAGANGYVTKDAPIARVVAALHAAAAGLVAMGPEEAIAAAGAAPMETSRSDPIRIDPPRPEPASGEPPPGVTPQESVAAGPDAPHEALTPRELELLRYMAEGYTNKEVARAMVLAEDTVKKAVQTLIAKLGAADRTHAVVVALRNRLID
jgi:DNA-binding NarL/FixJ family response regulator